MKSKPSESTERLIESLYAKRGLWDILARQVQPDEVIRLIEDAGEPEVIPDLLPILIIGDRKSIRASAKAIHQLLQKLNPADFVRFDELVRQGYSDWRVRREPWYVMKPEDVGHLASLGEMSVSLLGIASCHTNGYVRGAAVRELGKTETGAELPFLLIRANDWVPEIRSSARNLLLNRIRANYIHRLAAWLPLALRLSYAGRDNHAVILEAVRELFASPEAQDALVKGFESQDRFVRRFCFQLALNSKEADLLIVLKRAFANSDPQVRKEAVHKLRAILTVGGTKELLKQAREDGCMAVRREALHIFAEAYANEADQEFHSALLDTNVAMREEAQYYFRKKGTVDLRGYYSRGLETSNRGQLCAAIAGLGEIGLAKDSQLVEPFLKNRSSKIRVAALHTIAKLSPDVYLDELALALGDENSKVAREAVLALSKRPNSVGGQRLWEIYESCRHSHGKRHVLFLLARINKWDSINFLLRSLMDPNDSCVDLSQRYIARWFARYNRSFVTPTAEQLSKLRNTLSRCTLLLGSGMQRQMDSLLKSF
jgi:HEAT repeat protein